jgi:hypothetical protein
VAALLSACAALLTGFNPPANSSEKRRELPTGAAIWPSCRRKRQAIGCAFPQTSFQDFTRTAELALGKLAVEYHLNMVASEIMDRGLREDYIRTPQKILLVPTCIRGERSSDCKADIDGVDITCTGCDPDCAVNSLTRTMPQALGSEGGFHHSERNEVGADCYPKCTIPVLTSKDGA